MPCFGFAGLLGWKSSGIIDFSPRDRKNRVAMWMCYTMKKKEKETLNQSKQMTEHGTAVSPAWTLDKHSACENNPELLNSRLL